MLESPIGCVMLLRHLIVISFSTRRTIQTVVTHREMFVLSRKGMSAITCQKHAGRKDRKELFENTRAGGSSAHKRTVDGVSLTLSQLA